MDEYIDVHSLTQEELVKFSKLKELSENQLVALYGDKLHDAIHATENMKRRRDIAEETCRKENIEELRDKYFKTRKENDYWAAKIREFLNHIDVDIKCTYCKSSSNMKVILERNKDD